jgi:HEAT repeat protein
MRIIFLALAPGLALFGVAHAQQNALRDTPGILERIHTKKVAFDELMAALASDEPDRSHSQGAIGALNKFIARHPDQADPVKLGLIHLLSKENHFFIEGKNSPPDPYADDEISGHYSELIDAVSSLNDERAIPALVGAMTTGGMAQRGLLKYGDKALGPVLKQLKNPDALVRATALDVSVTILARNNDAASRAQAQSLIQGFLKDPAPVVRREAVREVDCFVDRQDFIPLLEQIASTDPHKLPGRADDGGDGDEFYPVRADARRVLQDIKINKACKP